MKLFLPKNIWNNKRGFPFGKAVNYLAVGFHTGQDFFTKPVGKIPVIAPVDGILKTYNFSETAGWYGYFMFEHRGQTYSLRILHMYKQMKDGKYKEGDTLGYCGGSGLSVIRGEIYHFGKSHEEQAANGAAHLHVELHRGKFTFKTLKDKSLAQERLLDPVVYFEKWVAELKLKSKNKIVFYKEKGRPAVFIRGADGIYYPIITGSHFVKLFGDWNNNIIKEVLNIKPKSKIYFGLFQNNGNSIENNFENGFEIAL